MEETKVISAIIDALAQQEPAWLVTVISTWGSSPRPPGSIAMWSPKCGMVGSVSGGCVEEDLIELFSSGVFSDQRPAIKYYGRPEDTDEIKLPCGGVIRLLIEPLHEQKNTFGDWGKLLDSLMRRQGVARITQKNNCSWEWKASAPFALQEGENTVSHFLGPTRRLLIVGHNSVAFYLAEFSHALGFAVTICSPSVNESQWRGANVELLKTYPDEVVFSRFSDSCSSVVAVSHDPRIDDMALLEALAGQGFYIGAMGSAKTSEARKKRLMSLGVGQEKLDKLKAPVGVSIGSKTPAEIAVSIAADLVRAWYFASAAADECDEEA